MNILQIQGPLRDIFSKHSDKVSDNEAPSPCDGGVLKVKYEARARATSQSGGYLPVEPDPSLEVWDFLTSSQLGPCNS